MLSKRNIKQIKERKVELIIKLMMEKNNLSRSEAIQIWDNSKTKKVFNKFSFTKPIEAYNELMEELNQDEGK